MWSQVPLSSATRSEAMNSERSAGLKELTPEEKRVAAELKRRDAEVRAHEAAHLAAAGTLAVSGANYTYQLGPDGKRYAIGGDVSIDISKGKTPEETIEKARRIRAAALAPANPSQQDLAIAAKASKMEAEARAEIAKEKMDGLKKDSEVGTESNQPLPFTSFYNSNAKKYDFNQSYFVNSVA